MYTYLITFDTYDSYTDEIIIKRIKARWQWARISNNVWCIHTNREAAEIRDELNVDIEKSDRLFVVDITESSWASFGVPKEVINWLKA